MLGAPKIQEITIHFVPDGNQAVARLLAGAVDLTLGSLLRAEDGLTLKEQWGQRSEGTVMVVPYSLRYAEFQYREPQPPPSRDVRLRQGLVHAIDRQLLTDTLYQGLTIVADMGILPDHPAFAAADRTIPKYPYEGRSRSCPLPRGWLEQRR